MTPWTLESTEQTELLQLCLHTIHHSVGLSSPLLSSVKAEDNVIMRYLGEERRVLSGDNRVESPPCPGAVVVVV